MMDSSTVGDCLNAFAKCFCAMSNDKTYGQVAMWVHHRFCHTFSSFPLSLPVVFQHIKDEFNMKIIKL